MGENLEITSKGYLSPSLGGTQGQATEIEIAARHILRTKEKMNRMMAEFTGKTYEELCADTDRDNWKSAEEALEYGLIDEIIKKEKK